MLNSFGGEGGGTLSRLSSLPTWVGGRSIHEWHGLGILAAEPTPCREPRTIKNDELGLIMLITIVMTTLEPIGF